MLILMHEDLSQFNQTYFQRQKPQETILLDPYNLNSSRYRWIIEKTGTPAAGDKCLDLGCGLGQGAWVLAQTAGSVLGVDGSAFAIQFAQKHYGQEPKVRFICADLLRVPLTETFDRIYCVHVLEHMPFPEGERLVKGLARYCHAGTLVHFSVPLEGSWAGRYDRWMRRRKGLGPIDPTHIAFYSVGHLTRLFETSGFHLVQLVRIFFPSRRLRQGIALGLVPSCLQDQFTIEGLFTFSLSRQSSPS